MAWATNSSGTAASLETDLTRHDVGSMELHTTGQVKHQPGTAQGKGSPLTMAEGRTIKLKSSDQETFEVPEPVANQSETIRNMIEDIQDVQNHPVPLPNVKSAILSKVIEYCKYHVEAGERDESEKPKKGEEEVKTWDQDFIKVDLNTLYELILAANYLNIKDLLDLCCQTVANMIKGKTPEEIRKLFNIKNDFTPEEEEEVRRENQWAFD